MAGKIKRLYEGNMDVLTTALTEMQTGNIKEFETQNLLYKFLEEIKFPYTMNWRERHNRWTYKNFDRCPFYSQVNYTPVVNWLLDRGVLKRKPGTKVITYTVNQEALANLTDLSPTYLSK